MRMLAQQLEAYLRETLSVPAALRPLEASRDLPHYLREGYGYYKMALLGTDLLFMFDRDENEHAPGIILKHLEIVRTKFGIETAYVREAIGTYSRKRFIQEMLPFVIPGSQMFLPALGINLRAHLRNVRTKRQVFRPATQVVILHALLNQTTDTLTPTELVKTLGYSNSTMTRVFDELEMAGLGEHRVSGKERHVRFMEPGNVLWEKVQPYLSSPVRKRIHVQPTRIMPEVIRSGLSALAEYTTIAQPNVPVMAYSNHEWRDIERRGLVTRIDFPEPGSFEVELWKYSPGQFAIEGIVDRLSLFLALRNGSDERIEMALNLLLKEMKW